MTEQAYEMARQRYAELGVDTERAMATLATIPISLHCWQGDDVGGFETAGGELGVGAGGEVAVEGLGALGAPHEVHHLVGAGGQRLGQGRTDAGDQGGHR